MRSRRTREPSPGRHAPSVVTRVLVAGATAQEAGAQRIVAQSIAFAYAATGDWVKDEDAPLALDAAYAAAVGAKRPLRMPVWVGRLAGGTAAVSGMTEQRAASNAKAKRELGWAPRYASWRDGFRAAMG